MLKICKQMGELRREDLRRAKIVAKLQMQWDKKRQNCRLLKNLRAELPMETQMAADVFPQVRQKICKSCTNFCADGGGRCPQVRAMNCGSLRATRKFAAQVSEVADRCASSRVQAAAEASETAGGLWRR